MFHTCSHTRRFCLGRWKVVLLLESAASLRCDGPDCHDCWCARVVNIVSEDEAFFFFESLGAAASWESLSFSVRFQILDSRASYTF